MSRTKRLTAFTASYSQAAVIFPYILVAPAYFAKKIQLGGLTQTASAFGSVQKALSVFVTIYRTLADWRAIVARLDGFETSIASATTLANGSRFDPRRFIRRRQGDRPAPAHWCACRTARRWSRPTASACAAGERTLVTGPSGSGKSTLFRAIAGIWPFGSGSIAIPADASLMMLPQRPYFPIGSLHAAIAYPGETEQLQRGPVREALTMVGLPQLGPGWTRRRTGTGCSRSANSSGSGWRARCCTSRTICSSTKRPLRSTNLGGRAVPAACREVAGNHHRLDRPPLDAGGLPSAQYRHGPRRRPLHAARRRGGKDGWLASLLPALRPRPAPRQRGAGSSHKQKGGRLLCRPFGLRMKKLTSGWSSRSGQPTA